MSARISIIIPCYNAAPWIAETLNSVVAQRRDDLEVIAINDGSTDSTSGIIKGDFTFVRLLETPNRGVSHARNLGTSVANGDFIQYLDADDLLEPGKLSRQIDALEKTGADVAYGDWRRIEPDRKGGYRSGATVVRSLVGSPEIALFTEFWCPPAAYLFRREIVEKVGGWNTSLPGIQDARFVLDCALHGAVFAYVPGVVATYRVHAANSLSTRDLLTNLRNQLRNAGDIERWWGERGGIAGTRLQALLKVYGHVARASYGKDNGVFEGAYLALERLTPGYVPNSPRSLAIVSKLTGYRTAESIALRYRRAKRVFRAA